MSRGIRHSATYITWQLGPMGNEWDLEFYRANCPRPGKPHVIETFARLYRALWWRRSYYRCRWLFDFFFFWNRGIYGYDDSVRQTRFSLWPRAPPSRHLIPSGPNRRFSLAFPGMNFVGRVFPERYRCLRFDKYAS